MKLLLDQNVSAGAADILRERGFDVVHTREVGLSRTMDPAILDWCGEKRRIAVTLDSDFHAILALSGAQSPSVIRLRIEGLRDSEMASLIERVVDVTRADLLRGAAVSVTVTSIRVRLLPLLSEIE